MSFTDFIAVWEFEKQQNIMQLSCIMTLDLKQLQHREDLRKAQQDWVHQLHCILPPFSLFPALGIVPLRLNHGCFIHNNSCAIVC